ncbi:MAG TPA: SRPBCC family protein [Puia sp.]|nr:SRPBCC family protein [Puia sp.]
MTILIIILVIIAIPFVAAAFIPKQYNVEKQVTIDKPVQYVFDYIRHIKNQAYYSKWQMMDPNVEMTYTGTDGSVGFSSAWKSNNKQVGQGEQTITNIVQEKRIDMDLHFIKPFEGKSTAYFVTTAASLNQTIVVWGFNGKMKYPSNLMLLLMNIKKMIGNDLQTNLNNLKNILEK